VERKVSRVSCHAPPEVLQGGWQQGQARFSIAANQAITILQFRLGHVHNPSHHKVLRHQRSGNARWELRVRNAPGLTDESRQREGIRRQPGVGGWAFS